MFEPGETVIVAKEYENLEKGQEVVIIKRDSILFRYLVRVGETEVKYVPDSILNHPS